MNAEEVRLLQNTSRSKEKQKNPPYQPTNWFCFEELFVVTFRFFVTITVAEYISVVLKNTLKNLVGELKMVKEGLASLNFQRC